MRKKITAIIPVRKGSQRVINKNIKNFYNDKSLLHIRIELLKKISQIDNIIVTSDCEKMLSVAKEYSVNTDLRPKSLASSDCCPSDFYEYLGKICPTEHLMYSPVTTPCLQKDTVEKILDIYSSLNFKQDSLATVTEIKEKMWLNGSPYNYVYSKEPSSQDLPDIFYLNFCSCLIPKDKCIELKNVVGKNPFLYLVNKIESIDIDTEDEFELAKIIYGAQNEKHEI